MPQFDFEFTEDELYMLEESSLNMVAAITEQIKHTSDDIEVNELDIELTIAHSVADKLGALIDHLFGEQNKSIH